MRRFRFSQETLLRLKDQQRRQAEGRLWLARQRLENTIVQLQQLDDELLRLTTGPNAKSLVAGGSGWLWCRWASQLQAQRQNVQRQQREDEIAFRQASEELKKMEVEGESLKCLRSLRWHEYRKAVGLQTQREMDAIAMSRWMDERGVVEEGCNHV
jgi:flagellar export protein FliJ